MPLVIGHSEFKVMHHYIQDYSTLTLSYPGSRVDQLWSLLEDIAIITIILSPGCQQPFLIKMASDNRLSAAIFGPKWLVTTGCQQPLPFFFFQNNTKDLDPSCKTDLDHLGLFWKGKIGIIANFHRTDLVI